MGKRLVSRHRNRAKIDKSTLRADEKAEKEQRNSQKDGEIRSEEELEREKSSKLVILT